MTDPLTEELLAKPVGRPVAPRAVPADQLVTRELQLSGSTATATIRDAPGRVNEGTALSYLEEEGQNPDEWEVTGFRKVVYGRTDDPMESVTFTFKRKAPSALELDIDELIDGISSYVADPPEDGGSYGYVVALGDMQFGKIDGDGVEGTLRRTLACIDKAAELLPVYRQRYDIGHVHVAWLGDHIEGFVSQGGANVWRTPLTLTEQIRLTRRVMLYALLKFADLAPAMSMVAVPGNHGEAVRIGGKGLTRYDDSHDTESLIAVAEAAELSGQFGHVRFYVPETDELTVVTEVAGTTIAHAHGHQWRGGKHFDWWRGQAFHNPSLAAADVLLSGHLHHEFAEGDGGRLFLQVPAMESESTWWRHRTGSTGSPGLVVGITKDGRMDMREVVRAA